MSEQAKLIVEGKEYNLPIIEGTEGERAIDISSLRKESGLVTLDDGYGNTGSCRSAITFLNGEKGVLRHRGYPIQQLCENANYLEVAYLLINGELPTENQLGEFVENIQRHIVIHEDLRHGIETFRVSSHPMAIMSALVSRLSTYYQDSYDPSNEEHFRNSIYRILAKLPTIAAFAYKRVTGQPVIMPRRKLGYAENFVRMMFASPDDEYDINPEHARAIGQLLILHADHEQNCSTSVVRMAGSAWTNPYASIACGFNALWGPLHGGANQAVLEMLGHIKDDGLKPEDFLDQVKSKKSRIRLMGFGHRVYKSYDPRAKILKATLRKVLPDGGAKDPLLDIAIALEAKALEDQYFVERKLYPNVDFYSGIIYRALGIPVNMFTVMFGLGRAAGWLAHLKELVDQKSRIHRPRQIYTGENERQFVPMNQRG